VIFNRLGDARFLALQIAVLIYIIGVMCTKMCMQSESEDTNGFELLEQRIMASTDQQTRAAIEEAIQSITDTHVKELRGEIAALKAIVEQLRKQQLAAVTTVSTDQVITGTDAEEMLKMLGAWRSSLDQDNGETKGGETEDGEPVEYEEQVVEVDEKREAPVSKEENDAVHLWVTTWKNKSERFPRLGHRRGKAANDTSNIAAHSHHDSGKAAKKQPKKRQKKASNQAVVQLLKIQASLTFRMSRRRKMLTRVTR
jgi:hypothetical protein